MGRLRQAAARARAGERAVKGERQASAPRISRASCRGSLHTVPAERCTLPCLNEGSEKADRGLVRDRVVEALRQEPRRVTVHALAMPHHSPQLQERGDGMRMG